MTRIAAQYMSWILGVMLLSGAAWAQTDDTGLPALPPGMDSQPAPLPPPPAVAPAPVVPEPAPVAPSAVQEPQSQAPVEEAKPAQEEPVVAQPQSQVLETFTPTATPQPSPDVPGGETPIPNGETASNLKENFKPSYGEFTESLFYSAQDIERMKKVLYMYEQVKRPEGVVAKVDEDISKLVGEVPAPVTIQEPSTYPSYYLSSIVYRSPGDWLIWVNGGKYTPKKMPGGLEVIGVTPRAVTFAWTPEYIDVAQQRLEQKLFDTSIPKHLRAKSSRMSYDSKKNRFVATLAPNQTLVTGAFGIYEGKFTDRTMPEMKQEMQMEAILDTPSSPTNDMPLNDPDAALKATMRDLQKMNTNLRQLAPRNNANSGASGASGAVPPLSPEAATPPSDAPVTAPNLLPVIERAF